MQALQAREQIQQMANRAHEQLIKIVKEKNDILSSDRLEIDRQLQEINHLTDFFARQVKVNERQPIEFLKLTQGHDF